jgi:hypothetical protein
MLPSIITRGITTDLEHTMEISFELLELGFFFFFCAALGLELMNYTLSHSISPFCVLSIFKVGSPELFARLALNCDPLIFTS